MGVENVQGKYEVLSRVAIWSISAIIRGTPVGPRALLLGSILERSLPFPFFLQPQAMVGSVHISKT